MTNGEYSKVFSAVSSHDVGLDDMLGALERVRQKLILAETSAMAMNRVDQLKEVFEGAVIRIEDVAWMAEQLLRNPVTSEDRKLLEDLLPVMAYFRIAYICSQIVGGFDDHGMPYDSAVLEARTVLESLSTNGAGAIAEFLESKHAAASLRTLHSYVESNSATSSFVRQWTDLKGKVGVLPIFASICELS